MRSNVVDWLGRFLTVFILTCGIVCFGGCLPNEMSFRNDAPPSVRTGVDSGTSLDASAILERARRAAEVQESLTNTSAPIGPAAAQISFTAEDVTKRTPDPTDVGLTDIARPQQVRLSLQECIARTLTNSFRIHTEGYGPSISAMDILRAEAAFDAVYFLNAYYEKLDQPAPSELISSGSDERTMSTGIAKHMATGATLTGTYNLVRLDTSLQYATLNPSFTNNFVTELRQPLLRNFGVDYNRSTIELSKNNLRIAKQKFRQTVRDVLAEVEKAYWQLVGARRDVVIQNELIKHTETTLNYIVQRLGYDARAVEVTRVKALLAQRQWEYIQIKNHVKDLEDKLKALLNDPELNLGEDIEIVPTDIPTVGPIVLDRIAEVRAALDNRSELRQAKLTIENARINVMVTKNKALPKLDLIFRHTLNGLDSNPGRAFDELSSGKFQDYYVGLSFEYPIGNRLARAEMKKAALQRDQAISSLKEVIEQTILEVNVAVRSLQTAYYSIKPGTEQVQAAKENLEAILARRIALSPSSLEVELSAQETLAQGRRALLSALVNYNVAVIELERAKDTLLQYNNVMVEPAQAN